MSYKIVTETNNRRSYTKIYKDDVLMENVVSVEYRDKAGDTPRLYLEIVPDTLEVITDVEPVTTYLHPKLLESEETI